MGVINSALQSLLDSDVNISSSVISQGSRSHNYIRDILHAKNSTDSTFPRLVEGDFLSGSYIRGTKLKPLDDIDVMVVIDGSGLCVTNGGVKQSVEVRGSGDDSNPILQHLGFNSLLSSKVVMGLFKDALTQSHTSSKVRDDEQAVNVWLDSYGIGIDVVPCFHLIPTDGRRDYYFIPEGGQSEGWKTTNPKIDLEISTALHDKHEKKMKHVIRLAKYWNLVSNGSRLKSYHIETAAWHIFEVRQHPIRSLEEGLIVFFEGFGSILEKPCADKTELGAPVDGYLSVADRQLTISKIEEVVTNLYDAYVVKKDDLSKQKQSWQKIFSNELSF